MFKQLTFLIFLIFSLSGCQTTNTSNTTYTKDNEQLIKESYTSTVDNTVRQYFVYLPKGYDQNLDKKWPVMMFLHGNGERGNGVEDLDYAMIHGPLYEAWVQKRDLPFIIIVPQLHLFEADFPDQHQFQQRTKAMVPKRLDIGVPDRNEQYVPSYPMTTETHVTDMSDVPVLLPAGWERAEQDLLGMLDTVENNYRSDMSKTYLTGLSYGGFGTWYMASKHPDKFAAIAPIVGWGHPELMAPIAEYNLPIWAFSGGRDNVIPTKYFYAGMNELERLGHNNLRFTVHEDLGHDTWTRVYSGADIYDWLLQFSTVESDSDGK